MVKLSCFNAYDVRGKLDTDFNQDICYRIGLAFSKVMKASTVVVGHDARLSSPNFAESLIEGLNDGGTAVLDLGLCGTEEMYFGTSYFNADGGIIITGSHNPINYNGLKMVKSYSKPLDQENEFLKIKQAAEKISINLKRLKVKNIKDVSSENRIAYCSKICSFNEIKKFRPLKIVVNFGNGAAGPTFDAIIKHLGEARKELEFVKLFDKPDGNFPNGVPNPMLSVNQSVTIDKVIRERADLGIAFDGDFDRCFFFDEKGNFISGEHIIGLLASVFLKREKGAAIVHDPRIIWNIQNIVSNHGGNAIQSRTGHAFVKSAMRQVKAIYGGEISAHHYFRDFFYCDSGMIPWLLVCSIMTQTNKTLSSLVAEQIFSFPSSGEHNFLVSDSKKLIKIILQNYKDKIISVDKTDGVSIIMKGWRMNLRASNTEPLLRLNIESIGNRALVIKKLKEVTDLIDDNKQDI